MGQHEVRHLTISGEVIEILNSGERHSATILLQPTYLTIQGCTDAHLGDIITLDVSLNINAINPSIQLDDLSNDEVH